MFKRRPQHASRTASRPVRHQRPAPVLKSPREIAIMRESGRIVAKVHQAMRESLQPGISTWDLDQIALGVIQRYNAVSSFLGYNGYPAHICTSVNSELVHGIPSKKVILREGDIISIDVGVTHRGFVGDSGWTYAVGAITPDAQRLMDVTEESLSKAIEQIEPGNRIVDVSRAVQKHVEANGFYIVREYTGHGVGRAMHEAPQVLNYDAGDVDGGLVMEPGLVIAVEPMVQAGTWLTRTLDDRWTVVSKDGSLAAHFEHTIAVTNTGAEILTLP